MADGADNETLVRAAWKALAPTCDLSAIADYFSEDYVRHSSDGGDYSRQDFRGVLEALHTGFPDLDVEVQEVVADSDRVAYRWRSTGTHRGEYYGVPPTQRRIIASGITFAQVRGDKITEEWASWNKVSLLYNLGIIPIDMP
jgi:steroid delta-isomerase-like uncharacterized protein